MSRCYVGNLPSEPLDSELSDLFCECGKISEVQVKKTISGDWYAFIHFEDADAAEAAVKKFDRSDFQGKDLRVELPFEGRREGVRDVGHRSRDSRSMHGPRYTVRVSGIPETGSWQDLKDHFRKAGECIFADVYSDGSGVLEYSFPEVARRAVKMFDNTSFRTHQGEHGRITCDLLGGRGRRDSPRDGYRRERRRSSEGRRASYGPVRSEHHHNRYSRQREGPYSRGRSRSRSPPRERSPDRSSREASWVHCSKPTSDQARGQYETM